MNFTQLRYFVAVARQKNFTRASIELRVAQPAISRQIKLLETELGTPLLARHYRGVELTEAGAILFQRSEFLLRSLEQTRSEVMDLSSAPSGHLRIGCPPALTRPLMLRPLKQFLTRYPKVSVQLQESIGDQLCRAVLADKLDTAVVSTRTSEPYLTATPLFSEEIWLFGPVAKAKRRGAVPLSTIATLPMLLARRTQTTREIIERRMAEAGLTLNVVVETDSIQAIQDLVLQGHGYTTAPYSALADCVKSGAISGAPIEDFVIERALIRRTDRPISRAMQAFSVILLEEVERFKRRRSRRSS